MPIGLLLVLNIRWPYPGHDVPQLLPTFIDDRSRRCREFIRSHLYLKNLVIDQVEGSISNNEDGEGNSVVENLFSVNPEQRMGIKESLATAEQEHLRQDGNNAFLGVSIVNKESAQTLLIEFKLQKYDDYWRVTEISNLETLLSQLQN